MGRDVLHRSPKRKREGSRGARGASTTLARSASEREEGNKFRSLRVTPGLGSQVVEQETPSRIGRGNNHGPFVNNAPGRLVPPTKPHLACAARAPEVSHADRCSRPCEHSFSRFLSEFLLAPDGSLGGRSPAVGGSQPDLRDRLRPELHSGDARRERQGVAGSGVWDFPAGIAPGNRFASRRGIPATGSLVRQSWRVSDACRNHGPDASHAVHCALPCRRAVGAFGAIALRPHRGPLCFRGQTGHRRTCRPVSGVCEVAWDPLGWHAYRGRHSRLLA